MLTSTRIPGSAALSARVCSRVWLAEAGRARWGDPLLAGRPCGCAEPGRRGARGSAEDPPSSVRPKPPIGGRSGRTKLELAARCCAAIIAALCASRSALALRPAPWLNIAGPASAPGMGGAWRWPGAGRAAPCSSRRMWSASSCSNSFLSCFSRTVKLLLSTTVESSQAGRRSTLRRRGLPAASTAS